MGQWNRTQQGPGRGWRPRRRIGLDLVLFVARMAVPLLDGTFLFPWLSYLGFTSYAWLLGCLAAYVNKTSEVYVLDLIDFIIKQNCFVGYFAAKAARKTCQWRSSAFTAVALMPKSRRTWVRLVLLYYHHFCIILVWVCFNLLIVFRGSSRGKAHSSE